MKSKLLAILLFAIPLIATAQLRVLTVPQGGTGWENIQSGTILVGNGTGKLSTSTCAQITGSAGLCDGNDASGGGGGGSGTVGTSTIPTVGELAYWTDNGFPSLLGSVATGTITGSGGITATAGRAALLGALTIGCTVADSGNAGCLSAADWTTFNAKQATIAVTWPITLTGATVGFNGLSTSTPAVKSNLLYFSDVNTVANVATGTVSGSGGVTVTAGRSAIGGALTITCTASDTNNTGCLSDTDWDTFNGKESVLTFSSPLSRSVNTVSCSTCAIFAYPFITSATSSLLNFSGGFISGASSSVTILNAGTLAVTSSSTFSGSGTTTIQGPVRLGDNDLSINGVHYKWPSADGAATTILSTDGAGTLSFITCATLTGGAELCDGTDATGESGVADWQQITLGGRQVLTPTTTTLHIRVSSTTIEGALNVGTLTATSGTSVINALSVGTTLGVTGTSTLAGVSAGFGTFSQNLVTSRSLTVGANLDVTGTSTIAGLSAGFGTFSENLVASKLLNVTGLLTAAGGITITGTDQVTDANVVDALTISAGTINNSVIGATTAVAGTFTNLVATASSTFSTTARITAQGTLYVGGSIGIGTSTPTYGLTIGNPSGNASSSPLAPECRLVVTGSYTLDLSQCVNTSITAVGNVTLSISNIRAGVAGSITACQDSTGGRTWTWDNSVIRFMNASSSGITRTPNRCNILGFKGTVATGTTPILFVIPTDAF